MKKIITPLCVFLISVGGSIYGQNTILNDFETGSPSNVSRYGNTSNITIATNPFSGVTNSTANCAQVSRTTNNWYELFAFPVNFTVAANTKKYVHMLVNYYAQPDISIRIDGADENTDGSNPFRPLNKYTDLGNWQDLVFEIDGGSAGITLNNIQIHPDMGFENTPAEFVLNNTDKFGYIDEILVNDSASSSTLSITTLEDNSSISIYPNPTSERLTVTNVKSDSIITISSLDGINVYRSTNQNNGNLNLSVKEWAKGIYIINVQNDNGNMVKKFIVQ